jgi:hypothetical protein
MYRTLLASPILILLIGFSVNAQETLPIVEEVEWRPFREHCRHLLEALDAAKAPLTAETIRGVRALLDKEADNSQAAVLAVQKLLDPHCLLVVSINPESRVKAVRGPAATELLQNQESIVLIKVQNDGGITSRLRLRGPEFLGDGKHGQGRWLQSALVTDAPFEPKLSGRRLEYRLLRLVARESGKREATFQFDVGQGTQDLGFRAEVPILFSVRKANGRRQPAGSNY